MITIKKIVQKRDKIVYTSKGNPDAESIRIILEENYGLMISSADATRVIKRGRIKRPEVFVQRRDED